MKWWMVKFSIKNMSFGEVIFDEPQIDWVRGHSNNTWRLRGGGEGGSGKVSPNIAEEERGLAKTSHDNFLWFFFYLPVLTCCHITQGLRGVGGGVHNIDAHGLKIQGEGQWGFCQIFGGRVHFYPPPCVHLWGGVRKCGKSVTYYLNGPLSQQGPTPGFPTTEVFFSLHKRFTIMPNCNLIFLKN